MSSVKIWDEPTEEEVNRILADVGIADRATLRRDAKALRDWLRDEPHLPTVTGRLRGAGSRRRPCPGS